ncbi:co-regulatory protein PtrA N-terminal domain-containing protein [Pseudomonas sp. NFX224]|uniref:co-regulatory protein PtrA N-terminal domain-containing protein n=1 Tax=Pseudomonas sp. NFX224 TaxID=3402862 RepID=UPI003AFA6654
MKSVQMGAFLAALLMSSVALAEGGGDRTIEKAMAANDRSMELFVARQQGRDPVVVNEKKDDKTKDL